MVGNLGRYEVSRAQPRAPAPVRVENFLELRLFQEGRIARNAADGRHAAASQQLIPLLYSGAGSHLLTRGSIETIALLRIGRGYGIREQQTGQRYHS
jgi:hypothetical protein